MAFVKKVVTQFSGLDAERAPELIEDGAASDIENYRMEKLGKLVSRSGAVSGLNVVPEDLLAAIDNANYSAVKIVSVRGIGELILSEQFGVQDTDRYMAYYVIIEATLSGGGTEKLAALMLAPLSGVNRDQGARGENTVFIAVRPPGYTGSGGDTNFVVPDDAEWIRSLVDMTEFRHRLIVADPNSGDFEIRDLFDFADETTCETPEHQLQARANHLASFDIDIVKLDYQLGAAEKNGIGVESGMALYRFQLPGKDGQATRDNFADVLSSSDRIRTNNLNSAVSDVVRYMRAGAGSSFLAIALYQTQNSNSVQTYTYDGETWYCDVRINTGNQFVFSNYEGESIFPDAMGRLELEQEERTDAEGTTTESGADVYIWEDYPLSYYPCSGKDADGDGEPESEQFSRPIDQFYTKRTSGIPRIQELTAHTGRAAEVPAGNWQYRFVWDFGNGEYSAPSTPLVANDILFSAVKDADYSAGKYERFAAVDSGDELLSAIPVELTDYGNPPAYPTQFDMPALFNGDSLTEIGAKLFTLKHELYGESHSYGSRTAPPANPADVYTALAGAANREKRGEFGAMVTAFFSASLLEMKGFAAEVAKVDVSPVRLHSMKLIVPVFQVASNFRSHNSVFDDNGKLRLAWVSNADPRRQFAFNDNNGFIDGQLGDARGILDDILLNIVADQTDPTGDNWDHNNEPSSTRDARRTCTMLRAIQRDPDSLERTQGTIDPEALARLVLNGTAEITIVDFGDRIHFETLYTQDLSGPTPVLDPIMERDRVRRSLGIGATAEGSGLVPRAAFADNFRVVLYGPATRFAGLEQLTAYFPSSLIFRAPRIRLHIDNASVPREAKRLLIFRTKSALANDYDPLSYGLVKELPIERYVDSDTPPPGLGPGDVKGGTLEFFDDVEDSLLDFSRSPGEFEGLREALKSRFVTALNERVYYANYTETYQPPAPRGQVP